MPTSASETAEGSRECVEEFCLALSAGRCADAIDFLAPRVSWWVGGTVPGLSGTRVGDDVPALINNVLDMAVDGCLHVEPRSWTVEGARVAVEALVSARLRTGRDYRNEYHFAFTVDGGLIASVRAYLDTEHLRETFGSLSTSVQSV